MGSLPQSENWWGCKWYKVINVKKVEFIFLPMSGEAVFCIAGIKLCNRNKCDVRMMIWIFCFVFFSFSFFCCHQHVKINLNCIWPTQENKSREKISFWSPVLEDRLIGSQLQVRIDACKGEISFKSSVFRR